MVEVPVRSNLEYHFPRNHKNSLFRIVWMTFFEELKKNISKTRQKTFPRFKNISLIISEKDSVTFLFEVLVSFSSEFGRTILLISGKTRVVIGQSSISEFWKKSV